MIELVQHLEVSWKKLQRNGKRLAITAYRSAVQCVCRWCKKVNTNKVMQLMLDLVIPLLQIDKGSYALYLKGYSRIWLLLPTSNGGNFIHCEMDERDMARMVHAQEVTDTETNTYRLDIT